LSLTIHIFRNAPYILATRAIAAPIAAGNAAILKGSESSPKTMHSIVSVFQQAGLPPGVLNFIVHDAMSAASVTEKLIANPLIAKINFTGSTAVGRIIGRLASENLKPALLELGGKAPAIIWEDADLDAAAQACVLGAFLNAGQICMSTERIIIHGRVLAQFQQRFVKAIEQIFGADCAAPVLINSGAVRRNKELVQDALRKGATLVYGHVDKSFASDAGMRPIVLSGVTREMEVYSKESFGPSVALYAVNSEEEALALANDTEYGLSSAIFCADLARALRMAQGIDSGAVHINTMTVHDESALPHGGFKASGFGRFNAGTGLQEWLRTKTITYRIGGS
jgi:acyl-CoA reductase-like NAD-dependent aldehyde dehydrogenase